jgi:hypothetical protein
MEIHSESITPPLLSRFTTGKNQQNALQIANRENQSRIMHEFSRRNRKFTRQKFQNLLSDKVPRRYGLKSFSLVHTRSDMSSLDYFVITSFPHPFPQLSKNDLIDMFLLDHKEIRDERVCVSVHLFCHDQHSKVFLIL